MSQAIARIAAIVKAETGLAFADARAETLATRARELAAEMALADVADLVIRLEREGADGPAMRRLIDRLVTDESSWFRYPDHFETLVDYVLPAAVSRASFNNTGTVRILSAGCSRGQEPYSIAMAVAARPEVLGGRELDIVAVDLSDGVLRVAREALYTEFEMRGLTDLARNRHFTREGTRWRLNDDVRARVEFHRRNLLRELDLGLFDIVFCRNVTIYFEPADTEYALRRLLDALRPGGHLFTGHAESFQGMDVELRMLQMARSIVYRRARGGGASADSTMGLGLRERSGGGSR